MSAPASRMRVSIRGFLVLTPDCDAVSSDVPMTEPDVDAFAVDVSGASDGVVSSFGEDADALAPAAAIAAQVDIVKVGLVADISGHFELWFGAMSLRSSDGRQCRYRG